MWVSTVLVSVKYSQPHASRSRSSRDTTLPAFFIRLAKSSNSRGVRSISPCSPDAGRDGVVRAGEVAAGAAAQQRADAGDELAHAERLCQVIVPADLQANHLVELRVARR